MWIKGIFLLLFALTIDALQAIMAWLFLTAGAALQAITPAGGAVAGAVAGASYCWSSSGNIIQGITSAAACTIPGAFFGAAASALGTPLGIGLGFAVDVAISITMGSGLVLALFICGMLDLNMQGFKYVAAVFIGEAIPGLDAVPGWTFLVIRCILKKNAEGKSGIVGLASKIASAAASPGSATSGLGTIVQGISNMKGATGEMARSSPLVRDMYDSEPMQDNARERVQLSSDVGREISARSPQTPSAPNNANQLHAKIA